MWKNNKIRQKQIDLSNGFKICASCDNKFELDKFHFLNHANCFSRVCKECLYFKVKRKPKKKQYEIDNENGFKICPTCNNKKNLNQFCLTKDKGYFRECKICKNTSSKIQWKNKSQKEKQKVYKSNSRSKEKRKKTDLNYKLLISLRKTLHKKLRKDSSIKYNKTIDLLGCDMDFYKEYIKSKFTNGMTWENHGDATNKWQLDHILPCELFDFTDPRQQLICFNYKNMQPLWYLDNKDKSDFLPDGRRARHLTKEEKLDYLNSLNYKL